MNKKKESQEELMQTHVLNLNEIREAEKKENFSKNKRYPIFFAIIGMVFVLGGIIYSTFDYFFVKKDDVVKSSTNISEKNSLICISNYDYRENNLRVYTKTIYTFKNKGLIASDSTTSISILSGNDFNSLLALRDRYDYIYTNILGSDYKSYMKNNILYFVFNIRDYTDFDYKNHKSELNVLNHTSVFHGEENIEVVKSNEKKLGSLCN